MEPFAAKLETIVKRRMSSLEGTGHSFRHVERVTQIAVFLASKEGADVELVRIGTLLHDIGWPLGQPPTRQVRDLPTRS